MSTVVQALLGGVPSFVISAAGGSRSVLHSHADKSISHNIKNNKVRPEPSASGDVAASQAALK